MRFSTLLAVCFSLIFIVISGPTATAAEITRAEVDAALQKIEAYVKGLVEADKVPGMAIAVVFDDEVVYLNGFGLRAEGKPETVNADTVFQLASFSKSISATVVAAIVSDDKAAWDSRIAVIDPGFELSDAYPSHEVTVRDLFAHRSGLPGEAGNELETLGFDRNAILDRLRLVTSSSSFRSGYSYSNFGLTEGGVAAARAAGMSWEDAARHYLYEPLGMTSTSSLHSDFVNHSNRATLHAWYQDKWQALTERMPDAQSPAGGVSSNVRDLAQWMRVELSNGMLGDRRVISEDALAATHEPLTWRGVSGITSAPSFYGLGWVIEYGRHGLMWGHAGAFSVGARTLVELLPQSKLGIVVLTNAFPTGAPEAVADTFFDYVFDRSAPRDWYTPWNVAFTGPRSSAIAQAVQTYGMPPNNASPALPLSAYTGTYANDYVGEAVVEEVDGHLVVKLGPGGKKIRQLTHFDRDVFTCRPTPEFPDVPVPVTFTIGPDRRAAQVTFDDLNELGLGTLERRAP